MIQFVRPQSLSRSSRHSASHTHWHLIVQGSLLQPQDNFNLLLIPFDPNFRFTFYLLCSFSVLFLPYIFLFSNYKLVYDSSNFHSGIFSFLQGSYPSAYPIFFMNKVLGSLIQQDHSKKKDVLKRLIGWKIPAKM